MAGVRFDAVDGTLYINSRIGDCISFLSTETGFGNAGLKNGKPFVRMVSGTLPVKKVVVAGIEQELIQ